VEMVKEIQLQNGLFALVDDEDYERVNKHLWVVRFANSSIPLISGFVEDKEKYLSHFVLDLEDIADSVSFSNGNRFDFRKENLIRLSRVSVSRRKKAHRGSSSKYKGVSWRDDSKKWLAKIKIGNKDFRIGLFENEDEAAEAYNQVAKEIYGEDYLFNVIGIDNRVETTEGDPRAKSTRKVGSSGIKGEEYIEHAGNAFCDMACLSSILLSEGNAERRVAGE